MLFTEFNLEDAKVVWFEEGFKEGLEEYRKERKFEVARAMFAEGINIEIISRVTAIPMKMLKQKLTI